MKRGRCLWHLAVHTSPTLVALAGKLVLHVQDVVVVQVPADMEAAARGCQVTVDLKVAWVQVQVSTRIQTFTNAPAVLLAQRFAAQFGCRSDIDNIMSQQTVDVLLHCEAVSLEENEIKVTDITQPSFCKSTQTRCLPEIWHIPMNPTERHPMLPRQHFHQWCERDRSETGTIGEQSLYVSYQFMFSRGKKTIKKLFSI